MYFVGSCNLQYRRLFCYPQPGTLLNTIYNNMVMIIIIIVLSNADFQQGNTKIKLFGTQMLSKVSKYPIVYNNICLKSINKTNIFTTVVKNPAFQPVLIYALFRPKHMLHYSHPPLGTSILLIII